MCLDSQNLDEISWETGHSSESDVDLQNLGTGGILPRELLEYWRRLNRERLSYGWYWLWDMAGHSTFCEYNPLKFFIWCGTKHFQHLKFVFLSCFKKIFSSCQARDNTVFLSLNCIFLVRDCTFHNSWLTNRFYFLEKQPMTAAFHSGSDSFSLNHNCKDVQNTNLVGHRGSWKDIF